MMAASVVPNDESAKLAYWTSNYWRANLKSGRYKVVVMLEQSEVVHGAF